MLCQIKKTFHFSEDGFTTKKATVGHQCEIPLHLLDGLTEAGYVAPLAVTAEPESEKPEAPESEYEAMSLEALKAEYFERLGKKPHWRASRETLLTHLNEA